MSTETELLVEAAYSRLAACADHDSRIRTTAGFPLDAIILLLRDLIIT